MSAPVSGDGHSTDRTDPGAHPVAASPGPAPEGLLSHRQILTIFAGLMIGMFLAALDQTIVATSIRTIADDLDGLSLQAWATTAYLITATITTPLYGKLSDIYGRKPLFLTAISIFVLGSIACTFATSMYQLAAFRGAPGTRRGRAVLARTDDHRRTSWRPGNGPSTRATSSRCSARPACSGRWPAASSPASPRSSASPGGAGCS